MAEIRTLGLETIEVGDIALDGGVSTSFAPLGVTYRETAELTQEDPEVTEHYSEENDEPEEIVTSKGKTTITWSIINSDPETLAGVLGGQVKLVDGNDVWEAPPGGVEIEKSIRVTPKRGARITIPRAKIVAKINYKIARTGIFMVELTATVLTPRKAGTASMIIG